MPHYLYDENHVRYELYQSNGGEAFNWLLLPGGPGADSSYFHSLIDSVDLPGNVWLIDLPGSGSNVKDIPADYNYDQWFDIFLSVVKKFDSPVLVGHSFGGMLPLLFPEMEKYLRGFVILNSTPAFHLEEALKYSKQFDLPDLTPEMQEFTLNPSQKTFDKALEACMPYYFAKETLEKGRQMLLQVPFQYRPAVWWQLKATDFSAKWIPQNIPTMVIGAKYDCICPYTLFKNDPRFQRPNIEIVYFDDVGHVGWMENPEEFRTVFDSFLENSLSGVSV